MNLPGNTPFAHKQGLFIKLEKGYFMSPQEKAKKVGIIFIALLIIGGLVLTYTGNDAVVMGREKKEGILTAEQVKLSFDSVKGRLIKENVKEGEYVQKGEILMELDPTDTDLSIEKMKAEIAALDAQIKSMETSKNISHFHADTTEVQSKRQIEQQQAAVDSAKATLKNRETDYARKNELFASGAVALSVVDDATMALDVARANLAQQEEALSRLLAGANNGEMLPTIVEEHLRADNIANDIAALQSQKKQKEVALKELEVAKSRLTLRAPEDGKILSILQKEGEMIAPNTPVIILESDRLYYDIYLGEDIAGNLKEGDRIRGHAVNNNKEVIGTIRLMTKAPGFADLRQTREKGQSDLSSFQIRIYVDGQEGIMAGLTIGVDANGLNQK